MKVGKTFCTFMLTKLCNTVFVVTKNKKNEIKYFYEAVYLFTWNKFCYEMRFKRLYLNMVVENLQYMS